MRIIHTADLHIGKQVNGFSMIHEQAYALDQIVKNINEYNVDVLIIAGDVYDKRNPSDESVALFNSFLSQVAALDITVLIISGNHDSGVKLQFGHEILKHQGIHIVGKYEEQLEKIVVADEYGNINFYMLPFIRPADVRADYPEVASYHDAVNWVIKKADIDYSQRNVFIGHQFFAGGMEIRSESEQITVGGLDNVAYTVLEGFDYAALGHLHKPQKLGYETIRYSGSIVKYSQSEVNDQKSIVLIDFNEKDDLSFELIALQSHHQFVNLKGYLDDLLKLPASDDYIFVTLLDDDVIDALNKLRTRFKNIMSLDFDNKRTQMQQALEATVNVEDLSVMELFQQFYEKQNNQELSDKQTEIINKVLERIDDHASH